MKKLLAIFTLLICIITPIAFSACKKVYATYVFDSAIITIDNVKNKAYTDKIYSLLDGGKLVFKKDGNVSTKIFDNYVKKETNNNKAYATHDYKWKIENDRLYLIANEGVKFYDDFDFRLTDTLLCAPVDYIAMIDGWKMEGKDLIGEVHNNVQGSTIYAKVVFKKK